MTFLLAFGAGCASTHQKTDMPLIEGGPGENLKRLTVLMQTPAERRQPDIPPLEPSASPSSGEGGPGGALKQLITLMQTPSGRHRGAVSMAADNASAPPVETSRNAAIPRAESPPATPSAEPATTPTPATVAAGAVEPKEEVPTPGTGQPSGSRLETAALIPPMPRPAPSESLRSRVESLSLDRSYRLGPEDVVNVGVWENKDLTMDVTVRPDGKISLPLINDVQAADLTPLELAGAITEKLRAYIKDPHVTVIVTQLVAPKIFVIGNVLRPGNYPLRQEMTVLQALSLAGGFTTFASPRNIKLLRSTGNGQEVRKIDFYKMIGEGGEGNHTLKSRDTIVVP